MKDKGKGHKMKECSFISIIPNLLVSLHSDRAKPRKSPSLSKTRRATPVEPFSYRNVIEPFKYERTTKLKKYGSTQLLLSDKSKGASSEEGFISTRLRVTPSEAAGQKLPDGPGSKKHQICL